MVKLLVAIIPAILVVAIAVLSAQNGDPMPLKFLSGETVGIPVGIWIAFALAAGMVLTAILITFFGKKKKYS